MKRTKADERAASIANLARLNELYAKYRRADDLLKKEYVKKYAQIEADFCGKQRAVQLSLSKYKLLRKALPRTKLDISTGNFFYAEENGQEVFAIKVSREHSCTVYVTAKNAEEAVKTATAIVEADTELLEDKGLRAEDVSQ